MPSLFTVTLIQLFVGVLLFVALVYGQRDLAILALLVLGVVSGARLWARFSLSGLKCHLRLDKRRVFPGEKLTLSLTAENIKLLPIWLELHVPVGTLLQGSSGERVLSKANSLLWYQGTQFQWELAAGRRGVYPIGPLYIRAGDLFSFSWRDKRVDEVYSLVVYPRLVSLKPLSLPQRDFFGVPKAKSPVQDPIYILGTRDYQHGQPSKYIHWKASARHNRLQEKVFESTVQEKVLLAVDVEPFARDESEEEFERTLQVAASLAARLDQQGHSVGLVTNGALKGGGSAIIPVARNDQQLPTILEVLARLEMTPAGEIKNLLRHRLALVWGICCVYFSLEEDESVYSAKQYMALRRIPSVFLICRSDGRAGGDRPRVPGKVYYLDDLQAQEVASRPADPFGRPRGSSTTAAPSAPPSTSSGSAQDAAASPADLGGAGPRGAEDAGPSDLAGEDGLRKASA